jgi:hypothetical protein
MQRAQTHCRRFGVFAGCTCRWSCQHIYERAMIGALHVYIYTYICNTHRMHHYHNASYTNGMQHGNTPHTHTRACHIL